MIDISTSQVPARAIAPGLPPFVAAAGRLALRMLGSLAAGIAATLLLLGTWLAVWWVTGKELPTPASTFPVLVELLRNPFYNNGPNDQGVGLQVSASLVRVFLGFGMGSLVAIPLGTLMGSSPLCNRVINPLVQVLRPVSPLAWFPLGLATLKNAQNATIFAIFITSLWPTLINTAFGVGSIPKEYVQVSQVFKFSRLRYFRKVLLPYSLPHIVTGLRLSMGVAWMVIVAGEMLSGGSGIGFWVWDSWNALNLDRVISGILIIGAIGLLLDRVFAVVLGRLNHAG
jgi:nitrate/nitrite transport system permease protein